MASLETTWFNGIGSDGIERRPGPPLSMASEQLPPILEEALERSDRQLDALDHRLREISESQPDQFE
ncbi:hypothetical protein EXS54_03125 [Patescibacteria group bacterium]|nr:hypothetical protein [Patescibacteria group bacterium]